MCVLALGFHLHPALPVLLAANRDEFYDRPADPPALLPGTPRVVAGRDRRAGGTWLGLNERALVAAVTNRATATAEQPAAASRGRLCLDALRCACARAAAAWAAAAAAARPSYNPFSLILADPAEAWFVSNVGTPVPRRLTPGWHVLANAGLDDPADPRVNRAFELLQRLPLPDAGAGASLAALQRLCADHGAAGDPTAADALCVHRERAGTRSATVVLLPAAGAPRCLHAEGTPCTQPFRPVALPWAEDELPAEPAPP